jgi:hypothetical protein
VKLSDPAIDLEPTEINGCALVGFAGANVQTCNFVYFDTDTHTVGSTVAMVEPKSCSYERQKGCGSAASESGDLQLPS